jgi:hypothetical protein
MEIKVGTEFEFWTPYENGPKEVPHLQDRVGSKAVVVKCITEPDDDHDAEVLPMYRIKFLSDGMEIEAFIEEITHNG